MKSKIKQKQKLIINLAVMVFITIILHFISSYYDLFEHAYMVIVKYEKYDIDEIFVISFILLFYSFIWAVLSSRSIRKQNVQINKLTESLHQEVKTKELINDIIAHDLRAPFNSLIGFSDLLLAKEDYIHGDKGKEIIRSINNTSKKSFYLLEDLLEWSKIQKGNFLPRIMAVDLNCLIADQVEILESSLAKKQITLKVLVDKDLQVDADENMLKVILRNVLSNAIKFTRGNGTIIVEAIKVNDSIEIKVSDDGVGISKQNIDKILNINDTFSTDGTEKEKGVGLGLILSMEFAEKLDGDICIDSEIEVGTTVSLSMPASV